jgi:hypothetical protein
MRAAPLWARGWNFFTIPFFLRVPSGNIITA